MKKKSSVQAYKGLSFAKAVKKVSDKYPNRDLDAIEQRSFMAEVNELMKHQEMLKLKESAGKAIKNYRQPVEASAYAKKALGGGLDPTMLFNVGQNIGEFINYNNTATDWDAQDPWAGTQMAQASAGQSTLSPLPTIAPNPVQSMAPIKLPNVNVAGTTTKSNPLNGFKEWFGKNMYAPLEVGKGIEAAGKLAMLATGYDKAIPQYNPYESKIRQLMQTRSTDLTAAKQDILSAENAANENLNNVRSANVRTSLQQNVSNQSAQNLARTSMQQQQINNQMQGEYASTLNNLGQQRVQAENYAEQLTQQSKAGYQMGLQNILESVGQTGQKVTDYRANIAQQKLINSVLSTKDFKLADPQGVLTKAIQGKEISNADFYQIYGDLQAGNITPAELDKAIEEAKKKHISNVNALQQ